MKYARGWQHFGHRSSVESTFSHAAAPPRTSSTSCELSFHSNMTVAKVTYTQMKTIHYPFNTADLLTPTVQGYIIYEYMFHLLFFQIKVISNVQN